MSCKVLALDIDGTTLNSHKQLTQKTRQVLIRIQQTGFMLVLASGRPAVGIWPLANELRLKEYGGCILAANGGQAIDCKDGRIIRNAELPMELLPDICSCAKEFGVAVMTHEGEAAVSDSPEDFYVNLEAKGNGIPVHAVKDLAAYVDFPVNKYLMVGEGEYLGKIEPVVRERFPMLEVYRSEPFYLEIMPKGVDKGSGLAAVLKEKQLNPSSLCACGDGYNDIPMIRYAGLGVAMGNASDTIKQYADYITESNEEDGVAGLAEKLMGGLL